MSLYEKSTPLKFPFKLFFLGACIAYPCWEYYIDQKRYEFMRRSRAKQATLREQSKAIEEKISAKLKDFNGNPIILDDPTYQYRSLYYGDFQTFFNIYKAFAEELPRYKVKHVYLTDNTKTRDIMANIMKVQLDHTAYAFDDDENIKSIGITKNVFYFLNNNNEVINSTEIEPKNEFSIQKCIKSTKMQVNRELDKQFISKFDFSMASKA
jgi:hypothetical protein